MEALCVPLFPEFRFSIFSILFCSLWSACGWTGRHGRKPFKMTVKTHSAPRQVIDFFSVFNAVVISSLSDRNLESKEFAIRTFQTGERRFSGCTFLKGGSSGAAYTRNPAIPPGIGRTGKS